MFIVLINCLKALKLFISISSNLKVLDKTLKGVQVFRDSITEKFFRAPGSRTKFFERFYFCGLTNNKQIEI